jgi:hypothetical protein
MLAHAWISVPSTEKCSSDKRPSTRAVEDGTEELGRDLPAQPRFVAQAIAHAQDWAEEALLGEKK